MRQLDTSNRCQKTLRIAGNAEAWIIGISRYREVHYISNPDQAIFGTNQDNLSDVTIDL